MAFTAETSNSGYKAPSAILRDKFRLEAGKDYEPVFSGKHDNSILGVANKDYPAAAVANSVLKRMIARGVVKDEQVKSIFTSESFPTTAYGTVYNLKPELAEEDRGGVLHLPVGRLRAAQRVQEQRPARRSLPQDQLQAALADRPRRSTQALNVSYACK